MNPKVDTYLKIANVRELSRKETDVIRAELARLQADAEVGKAVREMPEGWALFHEYVNEDTPIPWYIYDELGVGMIAQGDTPLAALKAAMEGEGGKG